MDNIPKGQHVLIDAWGVPSEVCNDKNFLLTTLIEAAKLVKSTIISHDSKQFNDPPGATAFVMLDESHFSIHTYSEFGMLAADLFTCGNKDIEAGMLYLINRLGLKEGSYRFKAIRRFGHFEEGEFQSMKE
jgi:S-adenosylmethionine decarboxylase